MTDERIINALDSIEPDAAAQRRMYANIIRKADAKRKSINVLKIVRPLVSAAACVCLVIAAAAAFRFGASSLDNTASGGADMDFAAAEFEETAYFDDGYVSYDTAENAAEFSTVIPGVTAEENKNEVPAEEPADAALAGDKSFAGAPAAEADEAEIADYNVEQEGVYEAADNANAGTSPDFSFVFPDGASAYGRETVSDNPYVIFETDFEYEGHLYNIKVFNVNGDAFAAETGSMVSVEADTAHGANAAFYRADNGREKILTVTWSDESFGFVMRNADGAEENEFMELSETVIENNRTVGR